MSEELGSTSHVDSLDGIRGIAVSLVVLFHFGILPAGWIGVQIFFVLSGYLITGILLREKERSLSEYLGRFYWRRSLRIFPLYFWFLAIAAASYAFYGEPKSFGLDWPYLITYTTNFGRLRSTDIGPAFIHLWSLAVEEQFYLVWPILTYFLPLPVFKLVVSTILILTPLVRLALYLAFQGHDSDWIGRNIYSLPISQLDAFASGAAVVLWQLHKLQNAGRWFLSAATITALCGVAVILHDHYFYKNAFKSSLGYSMFLAPDWGFVWGYSVLNITAAIGVICAVQRLRYVRILEHPWIVRVGVISYGIYVYHLPIRIFVEDVGLRGFLSFVSYVSTIFVCAEISYRFLETPFLRLKDRWKGPIGRVGGL
jgi:peptidoglycan/LPS O-acetylase OafA/YrhL